MTDDLPSLSGPRQSRSHKRDPAFEAALGARIRALRVAAGMSQTDLGRAVGVSYQQVQKYELGKDRVTVGTLQALADVFGVHPGTFFDGDMPVPGGSNADRRAAVRAGAVLQRIGDPTVLRRLLALAEALGSAEAAPRTNGSGKVRG